MGIRVDASTVLLLLAPLFLPKLYTLGAQGVAKLRQKPTAAKHRQTSTETGSWLGYRPSALPALLVALYSIYLLVFQRPFNFFTSFGYIPVTAPASQIQAALAWHDLADKYREDLNILTSLDIRALYLHFGHANLLGCYRLLGSASPKDVLVYTSIQLSRTYIIRAILLAYSNQRWKTSILMASAAGFLYEVYSLGTTDMRLPNRESTIQSLADFLFFYRNIGFVFAAVMTVLLPSKQSAKPLSSEEASLVQAIHAMVQRQDMVQTRIRVIEAAASSRVKKEVPGATSHLSTEQKNSLKAWLRTIVDTDTKQTSNSSVKVEDVNGDPTVPVVKVEDVDDLADELPHAKPEPLSADEETVAPPQVVIKRSDSEESLTSPSLSRSSSSSTPIDTPTPAMRRPMSMEITGATAAHLQGLLQDEDAASDFDQPLRKRADFVNRLSQSLGPSGPISHQEIRPDTIAHEDRVHRRSSSMYAAAPVLREPPEERNPIASIVTAESSEDEEPSPTNNQTTHMLSLNEALHLSESEIPAAKSHNKIASIGGNASHLSDLGEYYKSFSSTPSFGVATSEDDGWTTVLSKKAKQRTQ